MDSVEKKDTLEALLEANLKFYNKLNSDKVYSIKGSGDQCVYACHGRH